MEKQQNIGDALRQLPDEPFLPIEKKLVGWSLVLGVALLVVLVLISRTYFPAG
ncbi:MAG TPA: hypothetical protein VNH80_02150 [Burkholderiales bacterium]|jgi:hypothetical protein|nr:hypothetical protein [Burkholderiales bacterium]